MNAQPQSIDHARGRLLAALASLNQVLLGKDREVRLALCCMLARGHLLIEDIPGVGKTVLAHALARVLGLSYQRIQFTSDLLPAVVIGISIYDRASGRFMFHRGPVFAQLVLADEVNRATPKAQSALLEAMEERQVTIDGETHNLPEPFFIVATQTPSFQIEDPRGLLKWLAKDRALVNFAGVQDVRAHEAAIQGIVRQWIRSV